MGIRKSSNAHLKEMFDDMNFLFLEMNAGGLFEHDEGHVRPWLKRHLELLAPSAVLSLGSKAAAAVENITAELVANDRPSWHVKCLQERCPESGGGIMEHETCMNFEPRPKEVLLEVGRLKPSVSQVLLLSDGSPSAERLAVGLAALPIGERLWLCGGCGIEVRRVASADDVRSRGPSPAEANATFVLLPSIARLNSTPLEVWQALRTAQAGAFAPREVVALGGLATFRMHHGSAAEECTLIIAQTQSIADVPPYQARTTGTYKITMNMHRARALRGIEWYNGALHHSGRELWQPVEQLWPVAALPSAPKVLIVHAYGRAYAFTDFEHRGFVRGLQDAGHRLTCRSGMNFCGGELEVRTLYWHSKFYFKNASDIAIKAAYTKEYIKRWRPDVVFFSDDDVLNHLVVPCFEPLARGPNPSYHECSGTQYVGSGVNGDVRRVFRNKCMEYSLDGTCAGGEFFLKDGASAACGACNGGDELACTRCADLYDKARPVNITLHLEVPDGHAVVRMMRSVKPSVRKVVLFSDSTVTSQGWQETIKRQFSEMRRLHVDDDVSIDFDEDWHVVDTEEDCLSKLQSYQDKPEYMVWIPSTLAFLPFDPARRSLFWEKFLRNNNLGEVLAPGETDRALLSAASHPDSMGRVCAQYASLIARGVAEASKLPILTTPLSKVLANVGRALQLQGHGILPIPEHILARADRIYTLCPPGHRLEEGKCTPCPAQTFKEVYGDSVVFCLPCTTGDPNKTGLTECLVEVVSPNSGHDVVAWLVGVLFVVTLVLLFCVLTWRLRLHGDALWMVKESELDFGPGLVVVLGRGTFGYVVKAEYRGTMVAVKRVLPPDGVNKFDWEVRTMAFERVITDSSSPSFSSYPGHCQPSPSGTPEFVDLEARLGRSTSGRSGTTGAIAIPMDDPLGLKTLRPDALKDVFDTGRRSSSKSWRRLVSWREHQRLRSDFIREMRVLSRLRHPCVTTVMGAVMSASAEPALIMELMEHGSLYDILHNETVVIENELVLPILCDIAQGIRFLHAATPVIVHGDLKAQNVLVDARFRAKVSDFGLTQKKQVGACGTPFWMAPELLRGGQSTPASDVYAFGILLSEVCNREDPYAGEDSRQVLMAVVEEHKRPCIPPTCCSDVEVLMKDCWASEPEIRPSAQELDERLRRMNASRAISPMAKRALPYRSLQQAYAERAKRMEGLLYDIFPRHVADQLRRGMKVQPESREVVTIFFSDIVGFTDISATIEPGKISSMLDRLYTKFDELSCKHGVFKVETIGDAYMAVSNLAEDQHEDHAKRVALFSAAAVDAANQTLVDVDDPSKGYINIRVGFHSGPVVANVVGTRNLRYCLFGDTVNTSSRMESNSVRNHIHCSAWAAHLLKEQAPEIKLFRRGVINIKGKGDMETFWVFKAPQAAEAIAHSLVV